jgi:hypothetical protein
MDSRVLSTGGLAPHWLNAPTYELGPKMAPNRVVFNRRTDAPERINDVFLSCPCPGVQRTTRVGCPLRRAVANDTLSIRTAFHGVSYPSTFEETGSDLHRACLTRLCCASRLSQPLDALFRLPPFPPCFMRITPLGFRFQRFSLPGSRSVLTEPLPLMLLPAKNSHRRTDANVKAPQLQGFEHPESPYRQARCYPKNADRSSPSLTPLRGIHPSGLDPMFPRDLLSWAFSSHRTANRPFRRWLCRVSKNQRIGLPLSRTADLPEVSVVHRIIPKENPASDLKSCAP